MYDADRYRMGGPHSEVIESQPEDHGAKPLLKGGAKGFGGERCLDFQG